MKIARFACILAASCCFAQSSGRLQFTSAFGTKFYSLPDEKGVVAAAQKSLAADPKNPDLLLKLAQTQASVWQDREAVEILSRAIEIAPQDAALYIERGHRELPLREFGKARADLDRAIQLDPKQLDAYYHLGLAHYFLGEFAPAAEAFQHAVELAPNTDSRINSTNWLYASLRRANKPADAVAALAVIAGSVKNTEPHTAFYLNLVRFFQNVKKEEEAVPAEPPAGSKDMELELQFDTVAYGVGNWYLYHNEPAKAREYFQRILKGHVWITWGFVGAETDMLRLR
jgi:tetratricopeptide (TPR) repeat protein